MKKKLDPDWMAFFLWSLCETPDVSRAAKVAGVDRMTAYRHRDLNPQFKAAWEDALAQSTDALAGEAYRRAKEGVIKPIFQGGRMVGKVREYSDILTIFLLKSHRPEIYRETVNQNTTLNGGVTIKVEYDDVDTSTPATTPGSESDHEGSETV